MSVAKPTTSLGGWAASGPITVPTGGKIAVGFAPAERGAAQYFNWITNLAGQWENFLNALATDGGGAIGNLDIGSTGENANAPLLKLRDYQGHIRAKYNHMGYRTGQITDWIEGWRVPNGTTPPPEWTFTVVGGATGTVGAPLGDSATTINHRNVSLLAATGTTSITCNPTSYIGYMSNDSAIELEFMVRTTGVGGGVCTNYNFGMQFSRSNNNDNFVYFGAFGGVANWQAYTVVAGAGTPVDTGVAFAANTRYRMKIELIGSNNTSQAANTFQYRFYINGTLVVTTNISTIVADLCRPYLKAYSTAAGTPDAVQVGQVRMTFNHLLSGDNI